MSRKNMSAHPSARKISAHDVSKFALGAMVVLVGGMYLLVGAHCTTAAWIMQAAAFLSLMIAGIALAFVPAEKGLIRYMSMGSGIGVACIGLIICLLLIRLILQSM